MRLTTSQHVKLGQQMRLAPRMIASMEILQMPMLALEERIEQELESNVALEAIEPGVSVASEREAIELERRDEAEEARRAEQPLVVGQEGGGPDDFARLSEMEATYAEEFDGDGSWERPRPRDDGGGDRKLEAMANAPSRGASLVDRLRADWALHETDPEIAEAGGMLIDYCDDDGRLGADLATIADQCRELPLPAPGVEWTVELLERALPIVQRVLEPAGILARDARECLLLQVEARELAAREGEAGRAEGAGDDENSWADVRTLLESHFEDLLQNRLPKIRRESGMSIERIEAARSRMTTLRLTPGRDLVDPGSPPIIPDVLIEQDDDGSYVASVTDQRLPSLRIAPRYAKLAKDRTADAATRAFVASNVRSAGWIIEAIEQRRSTLLRVVEVVLDRQRDWFDHGPQHLRPLPMIEVADMLGLHVGTISRAVADKWMQTPRGLVQLRRFFSGGTETKSGEDVSWEAIKAHLREIVESEDPAKPLGDQAIADALRERGITIARRTVVKYREQLDIPPARRRKVHKG